jgi:adenosylhomocysteine nucleosidase
MIIGIIGAMEEELQILLSSTLVNRKEVKAQMKFNIGRLYDHEVVLVTSGIGKVNAAVCTQILVDDFDVDIIINVGVAGGVGREVYPGDVVIADSLVQHDFDTSIFGDRIGQIPRLNTYEFKCDTTLVKKTIEACRDINEHKIFTGRIVSGDQFISDEGKIRWMEKEFGALACEMEGASIAQVCYLNSIPFVVIRSISDNANNGAHIDYENFKLTAVKNSSEILSNMIKAM